MLFVIIGCDQKSSTSSSITKPVASVELEGICRDLEIPSPFKEMDEYKVEGRFNVYQTNSLGVIYPTIEEKQKRNSMIMPDVSDDEDVSEDMWSLFNELDSIEKTKYFAKSDIPRMKIYKISKEIYQSDVWNVDGYHSYVEGEGDLVEESRHYGYVKATCALKTVSREGFISDEFANQMHWCFDTDCLGDILFFK